MVSYVLSLVVLKCNAMVMSLKLSWLFCMIFICRHHCIQIFPALCFYLFFPQLFFSVSLCSLKEFEIELEGSQTLRLLCYEKSYNKTKQNKEDGDGTDRIMGKGQIPV